MKNTRILFLFISCLLFSQTENFTRKDSLKGSNTEFRNFWDVKKYDISVEAFYEQKSIAGSNKISLSIVKNVENPVFQIDLQQPMKLDEITSDFNIIDKKVDGDFIFLKTEGKFKTGEKHFIHIKFSGKPRIAARAPWDGGWVFSKDKNENPWISAACEGIGTSVWLPIKDSWDDEPDNGVVLKIITPKDMVGVGNGKLISKKVLNDKNEWTWEVKNPINAYSIIPNIGKYVHFKDEYWGEKGKLTLDYWVMDYDLDKAKKQFEQVKPMLKSFEYWFGAYPFYKDSYKLVQSPYLGMEHQSSVAYGNEFKNGYLGQDLSGTGVGLHWDYIIIHESGHEWFANNITAKDVADMWIHEGFTDYSETLYTESLMGKEAANKYLIGLRQNIENDKPIIGKYGVNNEGSSDMYYKGANLIHTIRQIINNDELFRQILRGLNKDFYHKTVTTKQVEDYISQKSGKNLSSIFDQYLRTSKIPTLEYQQTGNVLKYRWINAVEGLQLPIRLKNGDEIVPQKDFQNLDLKDTHPVEFDDNYYILYSKL